MLIGSIWLYLIWLYFVSIVGPAAKFHVALLVIKWEPGYVNFTCRFKYPGGDITTASIVTDHHVGRKCSIKSFIRTLKDYYWLLSSTRNSILLLLTPSLNCNQIQTYLLYISKSGFQIYFGGILMSAIPP